MRYLATRRGRTGVPEAATRTTSATHKDADTRGYTAAAEEVRRTGRRRQADLAVPRPGHPARLRVDRDDPGAADVHQQPQRRRRTAARTSRRRRRPSSPADGSRHVANGRPRPIREAPATPAARPRAACAGASAASPAGRAVLGVLLGVPIAIDLGLIWGPTIASVVLSFTSWNGVGDIEWVGDAELRQHRRPSIRRSGRRSGTTCSGWPSSGWSRRRSGCSSPCCWTRRSGSPGSTRARSTCRSCCRWRSSASSRSSSSRATTARSTASSAAPTTPIDWLGDPDINIWAVLVAVGWRHIGYVMILYLAGLKAVDPALKEAAAIDGANEAQTFFAGDLPDAATDQHHRAGDHRHRGAARVRHRVRHQPRPQRPGTAVGAGHRQHHRRGEPDRLRLGASR